MLVEHPLHPYKEVGFALNFVLRVIENRATVTPTPELPNSLSPCPEQFIEGEYPQLRLRRDKHGLLRGRALNLNVLAGEAHILDQ